VHRERYRRCIVDASSTHRRCIVDPSSTRPWGEKERNDEDEVKEGGKGEKDEEDAEEDG